MTDASFLDGSVESADNWVTVQKVVALPSTGKVRRQNETGDDSGGSSAADDGELRTKQRTAEDVDSDTVAVAESQPPFKLFRDHERTFLQVSHI